MVPGLIQGRIVWATINDPQGRNPKRRRCVVISTPLAISSAPAIRIVGVTTDLTTSPIEHYVGLQWGPTARTFLTEESAALATWVYDMPRSALEVTKGIVGGAYLERILNLVDKLQAEGFPIPLSNDLRELSGNDDTQTNQ